MPTEPYEFAAAILHPHPRNPGEIVQYCGGVLIAPNKVATAAHCVELGPFQPGVTKVRLGSHDWTTGGILRDIIATRVYPGFTLDKPGYDTAVLLLDRPVPYKPIRIARYPGGVGDVNRIAGWGATCNTDDPAWPCYPTRMQEADLRIMPTSACREWFVPSHNLCMRGDEGQMACYADSGSGQYRWVRDRRGGHWELVGTTVGDGDTDPRCSDGTGVWTDVTKPEIRNWLMFQCGYGSDDPDAVLKVDPEMGLPYERGTPLPADVGPPLAG